MPQPNNEFAQRAAPLGRADAGRTAPSTLNEENRSVGVVLATETPTSMYDYEYGRVLEVLLMSGVVLPQSGQVPLLDTHNRWSVNGQLGSMQNMAVQGDALYAEAVFSTTAEKPFTLVREGHLTDLSVGYVVHESVFVEKDTTVTVEGRVFTGPVKVATRWEVKEGSFTPIGADKNAKARAADGTNREETPMPAQNAENITGRAEQTSAPAVNNAAPVTNGNAEQVRTEQPAPPVDTQALLEQERTRASSITFMGRTHHCEELAEQAIRSGMSVEAFGMQVLNNLATQSERHAPNVMPRVEMGLESGEKFRAAAADGLLMRAGGSYMPAKPAAGADELRGYGLVELAREACRVAGQRAGGDPYDVFGRAFTSSDFPHILADVAHNSMMKGAEESGENFDLWTGESTANDFRAHSGYALDAFSNLDEIKESGEYTHGDISDSGVLFAVTSYGKLFHITRKALINGQMELITEVPNAMGRAAIRTCGNLVYALLNNNGNLADGKPLFHADHKNLGSAAKINTDSFGKAVTAMGTHKGKQDEALNIRPAFLLHPITQYADAHTLLHSVTIGTQAQPNQSNPWHTSHNSVVPLSDARLDAKDPKAWYLAAAKGQAINVAWLFGNKTPRLENRKGWNIDGTEFKVGIDFGAYIKDFRGLYKNPGA